VVDIEDVNSPLVVVDAVANAVLTPTRAPLSPKWLAKRSAHTVRVLGQWAKDEL
jgi:hypothetical protein